jgi:uncharacterized Fe-S cluster-containing protein
MGNDVYTLDEAMQQLPGLDCGLCGVKSCAEFAKILVEKPAEVERCVHLNGNAKRECAPKSGTNACAACGKGASGAAPSCGSASEPVCTPRENGADAPLTWKDSLGRDFDFVLDTFPNEPGPRETILPHNPARAKELNVAVGDVIIGRPMGMSCGCPITHCGIVMAVDQVNGVIVWCVTGPLHPRAKEHKDIGYYSAQAYEGIVRATREEIKIGMRYWFMPHRCMLQWRHSGLVNFINKGGGILQVRVEGLMIG